MSQASKQAVKNSQHKMKKSLGQNFLVDQNVVQKIVRTATIDQETTVIEIGPGIGAMTEFLLAEAKEVIAVEIDKNLIPILTEKLSSFANFKLVHEDFLKTSQAQILSEKTGPVKVIANLPYYITTAIINKILLEFDFVDELYIMVQKEVAERISASPNSKAYNSLSVFCQLFCDVEYEFTVKKGVFMPPPKIDSAIISLKRKEVTSDLERVEKFVQIAFKQKRKTLVNNLAVGYTLNKADLAVFLEKNNFAPNIRAEQISVGEYIEMTDKFYCEFF
ncbi:MAG: 16S rRNA (adenine(1518)-N(6)/adenine(1519)-N(6))-dimethyltransferase RsmA [Mycoplasmatales bacterium]